MTEGSGPIAVREGGWLSLRLPLSGGEVLHPPLRILLGLGEEGRFGRCFLKARALEPTIMGVCAEDGGEFEIEIHSVPASPAPPSTSVLLLCSSCAPPVLPAALEGAGGLYRRHS